MPVGPRGDPQMLRPDADAGGRVLRQMRRGEAAERRVHAPAAARARQLVDVAEEARGEGGRRACVQIFGRAALQETAALKQRDPIADADGFARDRA